jgi:TctA family transporter
VVLGTMVEEQFFASLIKADGNFLVFFERPIAGTLGGLCLLIWLWPLARMLRNRR